MRVYAVIGTKDNKEQVIRFVGTQVDAKKAVKRYSMAGWKDVYVEPEDIPVVKEGLLAWLNQYTKGEPYE